MRRRTRRGLLPIIATYLFLAGQSSFSDALIYEPEVRLDAGGPIRRLEEWRDGTLTTLASFESPGRLSEYVEFIKDIEYGKVGDRSLKLDLYRARKHDRKTLVPGLIFIHGGGWSGGDKEVYRVHASRCAQRGYVAVSVAYRLSGEAPFPAAVEDCKCAVRWMRAKGSEYGIDPDNIAVLGGSAGGHLAMMVGYSSDVKELEGTGGHQGVSNRVQAVVNLYGPCDLTVPFAQKSPLVWQFLGGKKYREAPDLYAKASPVHYLTKDDPPTLIMHGTLDETVPINQSDILAAKLKELGLTYEYDRLEGWPHTMDAAEVVFNRCAFLTDEFLAKHIPLPSKEDSQQ